MFKVINRKTKKRYEICSKLTIKISEIIINKYRRSGVFIVNFEHILQLFLKLLFEQVNVNWDGTIHELKLNRFIFKIPNFHSYHQ